MPDTGSSGAVSRCGATRALQRRYVACVTPSWSAELELVNASLARGDVPHALIHLGAALALAPNEERVHARIDELASKHSLLELLPETDFVGGVLLEAFALQRKRQFDQAITLLARVTEAFPARRFETLLATWLVTAKVSGVTLAETTRQQLMSLLVRIGEASIGFHRLLPGERELLSGFEAVADAVVELPTPALRWLASGVYRRLGLFEQALGALEGQETYFALIQRGLALRASGDAKAALAVFERTASMPDANVSDTLEQIRCFVVLKDHAAARALFEKVPPGDAELEALRQLCAGEPSTRDGRDVLDELRRRVWSPVQPPRDATWNVFASNREQLRPGALEAQLAIAGWESPSNRLLVALYASGTSDVTRASYDVSKVPDFPRAPLAQVRGEAIPTWVSREGVVVQASPAPPSELRARLASLSHHETVPDLWASARTLASSLEVKPAELIAAMVHPPHDQAWLELLPDALFRYQVGVACVLAQLPRPWSELRGTFESLLFGPIDWVSAAAVIALAEKSKHDAEAARDGLQLLGDVVGDLLPAQTEPRAFALLTAFSQLHGVAGEHRHRLQEWHRNQFPPEDAPAPKDEPAPAAPSPTTPAPAASVPGWVWLVGALAVIGALLLIAR